LIYLLLSILASAAIFLIFRSLKVFKIDTLQVIVLNYITAFTCGIIINSSKYTFNSIISSDWFFGAVFLGFLFIAIFYVMALTSQRNGISVASVASKMSVVIPVVFGIIVYNETLSFRKFSGILLALIAVYLASVKKRDKVVLTRSLYLPIILFLGSGIVDTSINYFAPPDQISLFSSTIFGIAFILGLILLLYRRSRGQLYLKRHIVIPGILLGIVNYASIYFILKALKFGPLESSAVFTINNVAIVGLTAVLGYSIFREVMTAKNIWGIAMAVISIVLITA